jgi:hypothetical protein
VRDLSFQYFEYEVCCLVVYEKEVAASGLVENRDLTALGIRCADHVTPLYPQKLVLTSPTGGGHSVSIVSSRTKAREFSFSGL